MKDILCQVRRGCTVRTALSIFALLLYAFLFPYFNVHVFFEDPLYFFGFDRFYYYFIMSFNSTLLRYALPIAAIIPLSFFFAEDKESGFYNIEAGRMSKRKFVSHRIISAQIASVLLIGATCIMYTAILLLLCPLEGGSSASRGWLSTYQDSPIGWMAKEEGFVCFVIWRIATLLIAAMIWNTVAILLSFIWANKGFIFLATFGISLLMDNTIEKYINIEYTVYYLQAPTYFLGNTPVLHLFVRELAYLGIIIVLFFVVSALRFSNAIQQWRDQKEPLKRIQNLLQRWEKKLHIHPDIQNTWIARLITDVTANCSVATLLPAVVVPMFILLCKSEVLVVKHTVGDLLMHVFGGLYWFEPEVVFEPIGYWLLILLPCMLGVAINLERETGIRKYLSIHRYPSAAKWWLSKYMACNIYVIINSLVMFLTVTIVAILTQSTGFGILMTDEDGFPFRSSLVVFQLFHIFTWQLLFLTQIQIFFHAVSNRMHVGFIAHIFPLLMVMLSFSLVYRDVNALIPYQWGIFLRSELFNPTYMLYENEEKLSLCATDLNYCLYGQMALVFAIGCINGLLGKILNFKERRLTV